MASVLSAKHYHDEDAAFAYVERHVWPNGPTCPHCGGVERIGKMKGSATRKGLHKCYQCRKQFTVRQGTIFESSHVPLHIWLQAIFFIAGSKKGISSNQLHRTLGVTLKTAWFMSHRIREAMRSGDLSPFGSGGTFVEADETFIGVEPNAHQFDHRAGGHHKMKVLALIDRETGQSRSRVINWVSADIVMPIIRENVAREARMVTDESAIYRHLPRFFASHGKVNHKAGEYGRGEFTRTPSKDTLASSNAG